MAIKAGTSDLSLYLGTSEVQKIYAGTTEVYSAASVDWDTYENGIWQEVENHDTTSFYVTGGYVYYSGIGKSQLKTMTTNQSTWGDYILGWWSYSNRPTAQASSSSIIDADAPPYIAVWDCDLGQWLGVKPYLTNSFGRIIYDDGGTNRLFNTPNTASKTNNCVFVGLTQDPGDISGWRDYDGPDDWDTWEDGVIRSVTSGSIDYTATTVLKSPSVGSVSYVIGSFSSGTNYFRVPNLSGANYPWMAIWNLDSGGWALHEYTTTNWYYHSGTKVVGTGVNVIIVPLPRQPKDITAWRAYDGPLFASWDEPARHTLFGNTPRSVYTTNLSYYEPNPTFFTTISQSGTSEVVPNSVTYVGNTPTQFSFTSTTQMNNDTFNTEVVDAALWRSNYNTPHIYNGWREDGGPATSGIYKTLIRWHFGDLSYNDWSNQSPSAVIFYDEEIGDTRYWPAYDGPVANWDTYSNGVYFTQRVGSTSSNTLYAIPSYPATTYTRPTASLWTTTNPDSITGGYNMEDNYDPSQTVPDSDKPPYIAVYLHEYQATGSFGSMPPGWYVYKNDDQTYRPRGRTAWEQPIAWPTPSGTYNWYQAALDAGYMGAPSGNSGYILVFLDDYQDPIGEGGTDHWTKPPWVNSAEIQSVNTTTQRMFLDYGGSSQSYAASFNGITDFGTYHYEPLRGLSWLVKDMSGYGSVNIEVYHDSVLVGTGTWNATVGDGGVDFVGFTNLVGYASQTDFYNAVSVGDRMTFIAYYND